jgi:hypothetical protein
MIALALALAATPIAIGGHAKSHNSYNLNTWHDVRKADLRVATILYRLSIANVSLCGARWASAGIVFHSMDQYPAHQVDAARMEFRFEAPLSVEDVVVGSPAELAGLRSGDGILQIAESGMLGGILNAEKGVLLKDYAAQVAGSLPVDTPVDFTTVSNGERHVRRLVPREACKVLADVVPDAGIGAISDSERIQISLNYANKFDDNDLSVIISHELAHVILKNSCVRQNHHNQNSITTDRRKIQRIRETEDDADDLSVWILSNGGYDPMVASKFWHTKGRNISGGILRSWSYRSSKSRSDRMLNEIAALEKNRLNQDWYLDNRFGLADCKIK